MKRSVPGTRTILLFALLFLTLMAGCSILAGEEGELPAAETVENRTESIDAIKATVISTIDTDTVTNTSRIRMISRPETGEMRAEILGSGEQSGTLVVSNGSTMYLYDRKANRVQVIEMENLSSLNSDSMEPMVKIFGALNDASDNERANVSVTSLPVVPTGSGSAVAGAQSLSVYGNVSLSYEGMESVDGRDAYVVEMLPQGENPIIEENTYWFDEEWYYPIKSVGTSNLSVLNGTISMEYRNVTFNPEISNDTFEFDIPENATVANNSFTTNITTETYDSQDGLSTAAQRLLPEPEIPAEYRFEAGTLIENGTRESISMRYTNGSESLLVGVRPTASGSGSGLGETIDVDGHNATIATIRSTHSLTLECGETTYSVTGAASRETIIEIAESLDC